MAARSWTYPADQLIALRQASEQAAAAAPVSEGLSVDSLHFNYAISGDQAAWRPLRAFDDGRQTFVEFTASIAVGEAPSSEERRVGNGCVSPCRSRWGPCN